MDHLYDLIEAINGFVIVTNGDGKIMFVSPNCEKYVGHQCYDMMGNELSSFIHSSDINKVENYLRNAKKQIIQKDIYNKNIYFLKKT
ncbi:aryl hydrocarbon receptor nuclear translocator-like protein [Dinothrombium tinctorium]|uniref:Aryl hydrocarbon receptor nuclear translocator-like protein n=1 Tax=Dinothrombium tinctorium TaxID=1965070 RepID=A0A443RBG9_9ACAR|nr:aryl hydrocarbon receptor nuclear translocator-like protein [Dinothrombium tinctorium]